MRYPGGGDPFGRDHRNWNPVSLKALAEIIDRTGAEVVISSTWRLDYPDSEWWTEQLNIAGVKARCIGITGQSRNAFRGREIKAWLAENPDVTEYVILDDESDFYPGQRRILTDLDYGLRLEQVDAVVAVLNGGPVEDLHCMPEYNPPVD